MAIEVLFGCMNVSLTAELEQWVQSKVQTGLYGSASEVVRDALRLLYAFEEQKLEKISNLRSELEVGLEQIKAGLSQPLTDSLVEDIKQRGRARRNE